jgi:hypothetical protein
VMEAITFEERWQLEVGMVAGDGEREGEIV